MATVGAEYQGPELRWPQDLKNIHVTEKEKAKLETMIKGLYRRLPPASETTMHWVAKRRDTKGNERPRRVLITHEHAWVFLNSKGGMPYFPGGGAQQQKIKYVWDCFKGCFYLKKQVDGPTQRNILDWLIEGPHVGLSELAYPDLFVDHESSGKLRYLEECAECTLPEWLHDRKGLPKRYLITSLVDGLRKIHMADYAAPSCGVKDTRLAPKPASYKLFHGDVAPYNILCFPVRHNKSGEVVPRMTWTDFWAVGSLSRVIWTPGWGSPETLLWVDSKEPYGNLSTKQFLIRYGRKKDAWAMGLIVLAILRSDFFYSNGNPLPPLPLLTEKIQYRRSSSGRSYVDDSGMATITQKELDKALDKMMEFSSDENLPIWTFVRRCLIVDPDKRPSLEENYIAELKKEEC